LVNTEYHVFQAILVGLLVLLWSHFNEF